MTKPFFERTMTRLLTHSVRSALLGFIAISFAVSIATARTYHVSPQGADRNPGTAEQPLQTISRGAELAMPGDTVLVHEGVYRERVAPPRSGQLNARITYRAAPDERVIIKGSELWQPAWLNESPGIYYAVPDPSLFNDLREEYLDSHNPLKVELASTPWEREGRREKERGYGGDESVVFTCGQVFVDGVRLREVPHKRELEPGHWYYEPDSERVYIHFGDKLPTDCDVELTTRRRIFAPTKRGLSHITVQGFVMEHCGNQYPTNFWRVNAYAQKGALGIEAGSHWIIRRNLIRHTKTFAIDAGYVDKRTRRLRPSHNLIEENYILDNGSAGILSNASENMIIRKNVVLRNNVLRFFELKRWEQAGIKCHHFSKGLIEDNYVADNVLTYGVWLDNQFPDSRISRNVLVNNDRAGIFLEMSDYEYDRLLVDNNIIVGNGENPVYIHDASGATFVHNLMANAKPSREYGQAVFIRQVSARTKTYHHSLYNNLMLNTAVMIDANYPKHRSGPQRSDYNVYGCDANTPTFRISKHSDKPAPWKNDAFLSLLQSDLRESSVPTAVVGRGHVELDFLQWKSFWEKHGQKNDANSHLTTESSVSYDPLQQLLTLDMPEDPASYGSLPHRSVSTDFTGANLAQDGTARPGPFQSLHQGKNTYQVWKGLPLLAAGELPPPEWNAYED